MSTLNSSNIKTLEFDVLVIGGGGSGAYGGQASGNLRSGAGGGSGYTNGSVTIISTQAGGNENSQAQALIELVTS